MKFMVEMAFVSAIAEFQIGDFSFKFLSSLALFWEPISHLPQYKILSASPFDLHP
jgi:hypothetical protein